MGRKPEPIIVDYLLETLSGETTLLRMANSGFGAGSDFDDEYDSTWNGWKTFLGMMQPGLAVTRTCHSST